jgi:hypothetical protein
MKEKNKHMQGGEWGLLTLLLLFPLSYKTIPTLSLQTPKGFEILFW